VIVFQGEKKLYTINEKEKATMTNARMAKGRFMPLGSVSFFKIRISAKQKETIINVKIDAELLIRNITSICRKYDAGYPVSGDTLSIRRAGLKILLQNSAVRNKEGIALLSLPVQLDQHQPSFFITACFKAVVR
jgi:hypothetical protein